MESELQRIVFVGDLHYQAQDRGYLLCSRALELWRALTLRGNAPPHAFVQVGDLIDGYKLPIDNNKLDLATVGEALRRSPVPAHAIVGNHETYWLPDRAYHLQALKLESFSRVIDGAVRIVLFDVTVDHESYGELTPERAAWLTAAASAEPARPIVIVQHQPIHVSDEICTHRHYVRNSGDYRRLLARLPNVRMLITGHRHIPEVTTVNSIPQVTLGAFCSYPFTIGELSIDAAAQQAVLRERPLEALCELDASLDFSQMLDASQRMIIADNPDVWRNRPRLTRELADVRMSWAELTS